MFVEDVDHEEDSAAEKENNEVRRLEFSLSDFFPCKYIKLNTSDDPPTVIIVDHDLIIKELIDWILNNVKDEEDKKDEEHNFSTKKFDKIILWAHGMLEVTLTLMLADSLVSICACNSSHPDLKKRIVETEILTEPCWPRRWYVNVDLSKRIKNPSLLKDLSQLPQIEELNLSQHNLWNKDLEGLAYSAKFLKHLKVLDLRSNWLDYLPYVLSQCVKLEKLYLNSNYFKSLPSFLLRLPSLELITRNWNRFDFSEVFNVNKVVEQYNFFQPRWIEVIEKYRTAYENDQLLNPPAPLSLRELSVAAAVHCLHRDEWSQLQHQLSSSLRELACIYIAGFCANCDLLLSKTQAYQMSVPMEDFLGNVHVPCTEYFCSSQCVETFKKNRPPETTSKTPEACHVRLYKPPEERERTRNILCCCR